MDVSLINPFIEGMLYVLDTTASVKARPDTPFIKKETRAAGDISGVLKMEGDVAGSVVVTFPEKSILRVVSEMFGEEMTELNEEINDAVGEISNMIAGHVTTKMTEMAKEVKIRLTEVLTGKGHAVQHIAHGKHVLALPFKTTKGKVTLEVSIS